jgi:hypothetical protein
MGGSMHVELYRLVISVAEYLNSAHRLISRKEYISERFHLPVEWWGVTQW